jgi:hypothetical protein
LVIDSKKNLIFFHYIFSLFRATAPTRPSVAPALIKSIANYWRKLVVMQLLYCIDAGSNFCTDYRQLLAPFFFNVALKSISTSSF